MVWGPSGALLDPQLVRKARADELQFVKDFGLWAPTTFRKFYEAASNVVTFVKGRAETVNDFIVKYNSCLFLDILFQFC